MTETSPAIPDIFLALRTDMVNGKTESRLTRLKLNDLSPGDIVIRTHYAGVNYKDCLAATGQAKIITTFPRTAGIELVGYVVQSSNSHLPVGQSILIHGFETGITFDGGFSSYVRTSAERVMALPEGLTAFETATLGVPGFTVGMCLDRFEQLGLTPDKGVVAVTGANGAVGVLAIAILAQAGYRVAAVTRRVEKTRALLALGASEVIDARILDTPARALEKPRFAAAIDNVGGTMLAWLLRSMADSSLVASVGNASSNEFKGSVLPFIVRRVQMFGIVSNADWATRHRVWACLSDKWKPNFALLAPHVHRIQLDTLPAHIQTQLDGNTYGRTLVDFGAC
ncbi:MAG: acryloyl-CoA reductase [Candidimonas sp.]|nr:MAG: acryloyl-CoA reductase [Candidimonas sp.]TAM19091.1 MAG: acryloyl-CoA reductase [Candidimonas sp.]TAM80698.1 MAG: acryloyl-CoA reductase [Candidimonas sp.]